MPILSSISAVVDEFTGDVTVTVFSDTAAGKIYCHTKTTEYSGTEAERIAEIKANGIEQDAHSENTFTIPRAAWNEHYYVGVVQENAVDTTIYFYTGIDPFAVVRPSDATGVDFEGRVFTVDDDQPVHIGARCVQNLFSGVVTDTITVVSGREYQCCIRGDNAATAVFSGAFTDTLTADGTNRIAWPNGAIKTATTASLT